jgi:hypothetical protein
METKFNLINFEEQINKARADINLEIATKFAELALAYAASLELQKYGEFKVPVSCQKQIDKYNIIININYDEFK